MATPAAPASIWRGTPMAINICNSEARKNPPATCKVAERDRSRRSRRFPPSQFQCHPASIVDAVEENGSLVLFEILIASLAGALPVAVVINNEHPAAGKAREEVNELVLGGFVPVRVEAQERDRVRRVRRDRVLDFSLHEMDSLFWVARRAEHLFNTLEGRIRTLESGGFDEKIGAELS